MLKAERGQLPMMECGRCSTAKDAVRLPRPPMFRLFEVTFTVHISLPSNFNKCYDPGLYLSTYSGINCESDNSILLAITVAPQFAGD